ncbi:hypothetical protein [Ensifer sp. 4252]|uniref:hypothetical protein n=1 Tax=Ensifer sp. 4252 TaxID=3373915 RepID=UPI003D2089F2
MPDWRAVVLEQAEIAMAVENVVLQALSREDLAKAEALHLWSRVGELCVKAQTVVGDEMEEGHADLETLKDFEAIEDMYCALHALLDARLVRMAGLGPPECSEGLH